ncbi:mannose-6-phosphate isomerase, class I, partial [Leucobacter sp. M11]|nr:mannose-6-phosphate isomerase, class I [Leucobacter sp. M11]
LETLADRMDDSPDPDASRRTILAWLFSGASAVAEVQDALRLAITSAAEQAAHGAELSQPDLARLDGLAELVATHPGDPGVLVSLLMHQIALAEGEALYLPPGHLHAYLSGVAVEVMASSDNVLRAGLTPKHVDIEELSRIMVASELADPRLPPSHPAPGITLWEAPLDDFLLARIRVQPTAQGKAPGEPARQVSGPASYPLVVIATEGRLLVERVSDSLNEVASLARGQALYISAGDPVSVSGSGEAFVATVGRGWAGLGEASG